MKVTLITGTRKGIGRRLAEHYAGKGHQVIVCSRSKLEWTLPNYRHIEADVSNEKEARLVFSTIRKECGRLDHLISNAGIASMNHCLLTPLDTAQAIFSTNVLGTFLFCREAAKLMEQRRFGRIVNFVSVALPLKLEGEAIYVALFSSGSTGKSKAALHDLLGILQKFRAKRRALTGISFLLYDHIGGFNTMSYQLSNGGCIVTVQERTVESVLQAIEKYRVELLPTSPTFINLIPLSEAYRRYDLSSLKLVTYGTEPMPESTLKRFHALFPAVRLQQTYGLSEIGILRSKSLSSESLWVRVGGERFQTRIVDGLLEIRADSAMLGYLNAPSPFTAGGWFKTGDVVETNGEWIRFLGRQSEVINVGGQKVYPIEVESVLQQMEGVEEANVSGETNAITGNIVLAKVKLRSGENVASFRKRMWEYCEPRLPRYTIPQRVEVVEESLAGARFKKARTYSS